ncbi:ABC transporter substrate-binding protein [Paraglaciecola aquimarina]|uniref:ABC transporter substrate-binding protein n=1 Tax=Paraglaciecola algarum TaxID=3050085 RepID=A0ABS9D9F4_9ALTE|nr:ABC transporter substrate-binding protein [Paraglaciecola sp. G1-23]MCF2949005.1 ABC transporter substrate-binding protein [Paraglaciecola sp. G1-23]
MAKTAPLLAILCLIFCFKIQAQIEVKFAVNSPGAKPYFFNDTQTNQYKGLIVELLADVSFSNEIKIKFVDSEKSRTEYLLQSGQVDAFMSSYRWLKHPEKFLASRPILKHKDYLYQSRPFSVDYNLLKLSKTLICTRRDFVYSGLQTYFALGILQRVDVTEQDRMLDMLLNDRCSLAIMGEFKANEILASNKYMQDQVFRSAKPIEVNDITIFIKPELAKVKQAIDTSIIKMKKSGLIDQLIKAYSKN